MREGSETVNNRAAGGTEEERKLPAVKSCFISWWLINKNRFSVMMQTFSSVDLLLL